MSANRSYPLGAAFREPLADPCLDAKDQGMLYYSGHGLPSGLVGVNQGVLPFSEVLDVGRTISKRGADALVVLDSCFSGQVHQEFVCDRPEKMGDPPSAEVRASMTPSQDPEPVRGDLCAD